MAFLSIKTAFTAEPTFEIELSRAVLALRLGRFEVYAERARGFKQCTSASACRGRSPLSCPTGP